MTLHREICVFWRAAGSVLSVTECGSGVVERDCELILGLVVHGSGKKKEKTWIVLG